MLEIVARGKKKKPSFSFPPSAIVNRIGGGGGGYDPLAPLLDPYFTADFTLSTTKYARISTHGFILTGPVLSLFSRKEEPRPAVVDREQYV